jgi:hypothetical protein
VITLVCDTDDVTTVVVGDVPPVPPVVGDMVTWCATCGCHVRVPRGGCPRNWMGTLNWSAQGNWMGTLNWSADRTGVSTEQTTNWNDDELNRRRTETTKPNTERKHEGPTNLGTYLKAPRLTGRPPNPHNPGTPDEPRHSNRSIETNWRASKLFAFAAGRGLRIASTRCRKPIRVALLWTRALRVRLGSHEKG